MEYFFADIEHSIVANYAAAGIETASARRLDLTVNTDYAEVPPSAIAGMIRDVAWTRPDAVVIMCTNLAGAGLAPTLSTELGLPVIDSVRVAVEDELAALGEVVGGRGAKDVGHQRKVPAQCQRRWPAETTASVTLRVIFRF